MFRFLVLSLFVLSLPARGDEEKSRTLPDCGGAFGLCGFIDSKTRTDVLPRRYERAFEFEEDLAGVRIGGQYGFIDRSGAIVISPKFDLVGGFYQGLAEVLVNDQVGVIDRQGKFVVEPQFARAIPFTKDVVLVEEGRWRRIHFRGHERLSNLRGGIFEAHEPVGLLHLSKGWLMRPRPGEMRVFERDGRGLIWMKNRQPDGSAFGLLKADGEWQVTPRYSYVTGLSEGRATVSVEESGRYKSTFVIDENGAPVFESEFRSIGYWKNGWGNVTQNGKQGLINKNGRLLGGRLFDKVEFPVSGEVARVLDQGSWVGLTRNGDIVADPRDGEIIMACPSGVRFLRQSDRMQIVGADGKPTTSLLFDAPDPYQVLDRRNWCSEPHGVRVKGRVTFVGLDGRLLHDPPPFEAVRPFVDGFAPVNVQGRWGVIDQTGAYTIEPRYAGLKEYAGNLFAFQDGERTLWVDAKGSEQNAPQPNREIPVEKRLSCGEGARLMMKDGLWGISLDDGGEVIKPRYRAIDCFKDGVAFAAMDDRKLWCPIDPDGHVRSKGCQTTYYPFIQTHHYPETLSDDPYESSVLWSRAFLEYRAGQRPSPPKMLSDGGGGGSFTILR